MERRRKKVKVLILVNIFIGTLILSCLTQVFPLNSYTKELSSIPAEDIFTTMTRGWSVTEVLSNESVTNAYCPKMAIDLLGNVHVVWYDSNPSEFAYRCWNATLQRWTPVEQISFGLNSTSYAPALAVDGMGNIHVVWIDNTDYNGAGGDDDIFYSLWNATTGNWTAVTVVSDILTGMSGHPAIAVDAWGNAYVVWDDYSNYNGSGSDLDIFYRMWNVTTDAWTNTQVLSINSTEMSLSPSIAVDSQGTVHVVWMEWKDPFFNVYYKYCNHTIFKWSPVEILSTESLGDAQTPKIATDVFGHVHVVWKEYSSYGGSGSDEDIIYKRWNATTGNWTLAEVVSTESGWHSSEPAITTDNHGNVHVTWSEVPGIYYKFWDATSENWSPVQEVSTESAYLCGPSKPTIAVDGIGYAHIAWEDPTNYSGAGTDRDIFYKRTLDLFEAPLLTAIFPNPDTDGTITLNWSAVANTTTYYVYRDLVPFTAVGGRTPIGSTPQTNYTDPGLPSGTYYYAVGASNGTHNSSLSNCESVLVQLPDTQPPQYTNAVEGRPSPQSYTANQAYQFNLTITDDVGLGTVFFEWNGTNHTVSTHAGDEYYYTVSDLGAGAYQYRWLVNDTSNNWNETLLKPYIVNKAVPNLELLLNGTPTNYQINGTWACNLTVTLPLVDTVYLFLNESLMDSGTAPLENISQFNQLGVYNVTAWYPGGANYSTGKLTRWLTVVDGLPPGACNLTIIFPYPPDFVIETTLFEIWGGTDIGSSIIAYQYQIDTSGWVTGQNFSLAGGANGLHTIAYRAVDAWGNNGTVQNCTVFLLANNADYDQDGLTNEAELDLYGTDLFNPDTDGDGILDGAEVAQGSNPLDPNSPLLERVLLICLIIGGVVGTGTILLLIRMRKHTPSSKAGGRKTSVAKGY